MKRLFSLLILISLFSFLLTACENNDKSTPTEPKPAQTNTLTLINDTNRHHIGDEYRSDFVIKWPEGFERSYTFGLSGKPVSGSVQITVFDMDLLGADILVNGAVIFSMPPPTGNGTRIAEIPVVNLLVGQNTLIVRARSSGTQFEDFEYIDLKVIVTIEVSS